MVTFLVEYHRQSDLVVILTQDAQGGESPKPAAPGQLTASRAPARNVMRRHRSAAAARWRARPPAMAAKVSCATCAQKRERVGGFEATAEGLERRRRSEIDVALLGVVLDRALVHDRYGPAGGRSPGWRPSLRRLSDRGLY